MKYLGGRNIYTNVDRGGGRITVAFAGVADYRSFIGQEYISGIMKACEDYDINFLNMCGAVKYSLFDDINFMGRYEKTFGFLKSPLVDGAVTWASSLAEYLPAQEIVERFSALRPLPMVDIGYIDIPGVTALRIDNSDSMRQIVSHLVKIHGYTKMAFFGCTNSRPHSERLESFKNALAEFGIGSDDSQIFVAASLSESDILKTALDFRRSFSRNPMQALVTSSDIIASTLIPVLEGSGIRIPEDLAVTGFNNQYQGISSPTPITTINLEYFRRGYMAVELLIDRIENPGLKPEVIEMPTSLVIRESCGCFEREITESIFSESARKLDEDASEEEARAFLFSRVNEIFPEETHERKTELVEAVFDDIWREPEPPSTLKWFRKFLGDENSRVSENKQGEIGHQRKVSLLRQAALEVAGENEQMRHRIEEISGSLRVLCSVRADYERLSVSKTSHLFNSITQTAIAFASVSSGKNLKSILQSNLPKLSIRSMALALNERMSSEIGPARVEILIPESEDGTRKIALPHRVPEPHLFPKSLFPTQRRHSTVLEILRHDDKFFGYAFLEMSGPEMELYDSVGSLISHGLQNLYKKENTEPMPTLKNGKPGAILENGEKSEEAPRGKLTKSLINSYFLERIGQMTNLDQMASDLGVNKTKLIRQTKALTGFSPQRLHEKLKMELAKKFLVEGVMKISEIAERLGFQNSNYFSNVFKKNTGESPRSWAIRHAKKSAAE